MATMDGKLADEANIPDERGTRTATWYRTRAMLALGIGAVLVPVVFLVFGPEALYAGVGDSTLVVPLNGPLTWAGFLGMVDRPRLDDPYLPRPARRAAVVAPPGPLTSAPDRSAGAAGNEGKRKTQALDIETATGSEARPDKLAL